MTKYFIVKCKCGHVGKTMYLPMDFAIYAENAKEAALIARKKRGVKHDHPDAVISVNEVSVGEYFTALQLLKKDSYWKKDKNGIKTNQAEFFSRLEPETQRKAVYSNKIATRKFRYRKACQYEMSLSKDIASEYGLVI